MQKVRIIQDFDVPRERVFDFFSQHERLSEIYPGAWKRIKDSADPTNINGLGSIRRITNFPLVMEEAITKFQRPQSIEYRLLDMPGVKHHLGIMNFYELDNNSRTRMDYTIEFDFKILPDFIVKNLMQKMIGDAIRDAAKKFRENPNF